MLRKLTRLPWRVCFFFVLLPSFAQGDNYLQELTVRSRAMKLYEHREWNRLLHYSNNMFFPGVHGLADAPRFYLAPDGKTSPQAELEATLASFFSTAQET